MALQSCYECNKDISTNAILCPQCGAPQNPVSGLIDKAKEKIDEVKEGGVSGLIDKAKEGGGFLLNSFKSFKKNREEEKKQKLNDLEKLNKRLLSTFGPDDQFSEGTLCSKDYRKKKNPTIQDLDQEE
jgi:hypothetical protein